METNKVVYDGIEYDTLGQAFEEFKIDLNSDDTEFETEHDMFKYFIDNMIDEESRKSYYNTINKIDKSPVYRIKINLEREYEAEDEEDALSKFNEELFNEDDVIEDYIRVEEVE